MSLRVRRLVAHVLTECDAHFCADAAIRCPSEVDNLSV